MPHEDVAKLGLRPALAKVVDESVLHLRQQGQGQQPTGLGLREGDLAATPVDVIETELANIAGAHAVACRQQQDRVVTLAQRGASVDRLEQCGNLVVRQEVRNRRRVGIAAPRRRPPRSRVPGGRAGRPSGGSFARCSHRTAGSPA